MQDEKKDFALKSDKELFNWTEIMTTTIRSSVSCIAQKEIGATLLSEQRRICTLKEYSLMNSGGRINYQR